MKFVRLLNDQGRAYDSYCDYLRLVELSGFAMCGQDEIDRESDDTYVFYIHNGNAAEIIKPPHRCRYILHQLERPLSGFTGYAPAGYNAVWVSDRWVADQLRGDGRVRFVPVGGHKQLGGEPRGIKWDITHQSYVYGRRSRIIHDLTIAGYKIGHACWGAERDEQLASSRIGLCTHQDSLPVVEPLRMTLFSCWRLPLVAEPSKCAWPYRTYGMDEINDAHDGETNYRLLTEDLTFRKCVERAL